MMHTIKVTKPTRNIADSGKVRIGGWAPSLPVRVPPRSGGTMQALPLLASCALASSICAGCSSMGNGVIAWAFPFSMNTVELGWYHPEDSPLLMLPALGLIGAVELLGRLTARRPASPSIRMGCSGSATS